MNPRSPAFPLRRTDRKLDQLLFKAKRFPGFCLVCGRPTIFSVRDSNFRESCYCRRCGAFNRQRQIAAVICHGASGGYRSLAQLARADGIAIYNTESSRAIHETLKGMAGYQASEYLGPGHRSGDIVKGLMHQDLERLSFAADSFDLVISGDVFEHVPHPYQGHAEIHRILKPGGRHVFTVPFHQHEYQDDVRAEIDPAGELKLLKDPIYHQDPVRPEGALVYTIFTIEMLTKLDRLGFRTNLYHLYQPWYGILGPNAIVFEAIKPERPAPTSAR